MFIGRSTGQDYDMAMLCIDAFTKYCVIVPIMSNSESALALGFIESMNKMGKPPQVVHAYGKQA